MVKRLRRVVYFFGPVMAMVGVGFWFGAVSRPRPALPGVVYQASAAGSMSLPVLQPPKVEPKSDEARPIVSPVKTIVDPIMGRYYGPALLDGLYNDGWRRGIAAFYAVPTSLQQEAAITEVYNYILKQFRWVRKPKELTEEDRKTCMLVAESIVRSSSAWGLDYRMVSAIADIESTYNQHAISEAIAIGIMQIHYPTWGRRLGLAPYEFKNIPANVYIGCWILRRYLDETGWDLPKALYKYYGARSAEYLRRVNSSLMRQTETSMKFYKEMGIKR